MSEYWIVQIVGSQNGVETPFDGQFVVEWNSNVPAGTLEMETTTDPRLARRFETGEAMREWREVSQIQPIRPWDGRPNRPLTALTINIQHHESHTRKHPQAGQ
jgi:hypothetical protein